MYGFERQIGLIVRYFAVFAVFISCLGLFGLSSFIVEQRIKEIGIRKVLGSSVYQVILLQSKEFIKCVAIANIIGWPAAWYMSKAWLRHFAYKTTFGWDIFIITGVLTFVITLVTVSYQAIKGASVNPVNSLRHE